MKMDRASIERLKSRGAHVISERSTPKPADKPAQEKPADRVREVVVAPAREDVDAAKIASVAALEAAEQMGVIAQKMIDIVANQKDAAPAISSMPHTGNAANRYGPFLPLAAGDTGVRDIEAFTFSGGTAYTGTTGVLVMHHVVPLLAIPVLASGVAAERDLVNQLPSMPRVRDGAHLKWLMFATGATTAASPFVASIDFGWGG